MHPQKFFKEVACKVGVDVFEIFDSGLKEKLQNIHPQNFVKSKITLPVYKIVLGYYTRNDNYRITDKYMVLNNEFEEEYFDMWAEMYCQDYKEKYPDKEMKDLHIINLKYICDAVLPIG